MANPDHLARLKNGVVAWNQWRYDNQAALREARGRSMTEPEFSFAHLYDIDLSDADLGEMALVGANLCKTNLPQGKALWDETLPRRFVWIRPDQGGGQLSDPKWSEPVRVDS